MDTAVGNKNFFAFRRSMLTCNNFYVNSFSQSLRSPPDDLSTIPSKASFPEREIQVLPPSVLSIYSFPQDHPVADYFSFLVFSSILSFL
jgi:hypothetical protein